MKHELIKTEDYLLLVSDKLETYQNGGGYTFLSAEIGDRKVLAHLPLNGAPYLDGVDVLPEIEDEVEKLSYERFGKSFHHANSRYCYREGYNKAKETYKYTEEDMRKAIELARKTARRDEFLHSDNGIIQSLNQPKLPIAFKCEHTGKCCGNSLIEHCIQCDKYKPIPRTITNLEGRTEWVGKYLF